MNREELEHAIRTACQLTEKDRLVRVEGQGTMNILTGAICLGLCLEPHDLCVAKLCAHREKDIRFVGAIIKAGLVDPELIADRLGNVEGKDKAAAAVALQWIARAHRSREGY